MRMATIEEGALQGCVDGCERAHDACTELLGWSLAKGGVHAEPAHLALLADCADICRTTADFLLRHSELHELTDSACAEISARCAASCDRMPDDPVVTACADACRACARTCSTMAS